MRESTPTPSTPQPKVERRPYALPRLVVHGNVSDLTAALSENAQDGKSGSINP